MRIEFRLEIVQLPTCECICIVYWRCICNTEQQVSQQVENNDAVHRDVDLLSALRLRSPPTASTAVAPWKRPLRDV